MDRMNDELPPEIGAALKALDARAAQRAAAVDVERVAARVVARLRSGEAATSPRPRWMTPGALRAAAAVVVLAGAAAVVTLSIGRSPQTTALRLPVSIPAMDSLSSGQLEDVLEAAGEVGAVADSLPAPASGTSLDGLSEAQLETLLASLNGAES